MSRWSAAGPIRCQWVLVVVVACGRGGGADVRNGRENVLGAMMGFGVLGLGFWPGGMGRGGFVST